eukprot:gb/GEZN01015885.1/.p1 GENE.gb/GEZN01015885.1/~~gb/GEZN01015885.1/.p1  ORF type:complete len:137 (-),score=20.75 gb/GEZN01015885.1/:426-836(-)
MADERKKQREDSNSPNAALIGLFAVGAAIAGAIGYLVGSMAKAPSEQPTQQPTQQPLPNQATATANAEERRFQMGQTEDFDAMCKVCENYPMNAILEPCRHQCMCTDCAEEIMQTSSRACPICRVGIRTFISVHMQ